MKILFAHNTWNRTEPLYSNVKREIHEFDDSSALVLYNNEKIKPRPDICQHIYDGPNRGHKIDCLRLALRAIDIFKSTDNNILIFSHDDTILKDKKILTENIDLLDEYNGVVMKFIGPSRTANQEYDYTMLETFILTQEAAKYIDTAIQIGELPRDSLGSPSPELFFGKIIHSVPLLYKHKTSGGYGINKCGYYHTPFARGCDKL